MKTIGQTIKEIRTKKKLSLNSLSVKTKIRREFLEAIEKEDWVKLPEFPVVLGFVKSIASTLRLNSDMATALLKRDYPPKIVAINPKPDVSKKFIWSPRFTFLLGIVVVSVGVFGYLVYQYVNFISPPKLLVEYPRDGQSVATSELFVSGWTESNVIIKVNNQPVLVDDEGVFSTKIEVVKDTREVVVVANSRSGKESVVKVNINVELE